MTDNEITAIVGWPTEPEMAKYRRVAAAAVAEESERLILRLREISMYECGCAEDANHCTELADQIERERGANQVVDAGREIGRQEERERLAAEFDGWRDDDRLQPAFVAKWIRDA